MALFSDDLFMGSGATYLGTGNFAATSIFSATISGTTMTVTAALSGDPLVVGQFITGTGVTANSYISANTASNVYTLTQSSTVSTAVTMYAAGNALLGNPSPMSLGVGPLGRIYNFDVIPQTLVVNNLATSQTPTAAGNITLVMGTSVTTVIRSNGVSVMQFDCPRAVSITQAVSGIAATFTITGFDYYGQAMTAVTSVAGTSANTATTLKAFYQIASISVSGGTTSAITIGSSDVIGLPIRVIDGGYLIGVGWSGSFAVDAGTFVAADTTATATSLTGDVRGTYKPSTATSGVKRLVLSIAVNAIQVGPNSTRNGALGVTQA